jgi:hypothetical protein
MKVWRSKPRANVVSSWTTFIPVRIATGREEAGHTKAIAIAVRNLPKLRYELINGQRELKIRCYAVGGGV